MNVKVYNDGKRCRDVDAKILGRRAQQVLIEYVNYSDETITSWFIRREKRGVFECKECNYFYLPFLEQT